MVEIRLTRIVKIIGPDLARIGLAIGYARHFDRIWHGISLFTIFITVYYVQIKLFLIKLIVSIDYTAESLESQNGDSPSLGLGRQQK